MRGLFVSFEGTEGCGKSTQLAALAGRLRRTGREVVETREPGGTVLGEAVRRLLQHDPAGEGMVPEAEILLFEASRAQHVRETIRPALARGACVLCDRFHDSTTVYQGVARQLDPAMVSRLNEYSVGDTLPDLTILLDLDPEAGLARARQRSGGRLDRLEREAMAFFEAVRAGYRKLAKTDPARFLVLDGDSPEEGLAERIWSAVGERLEA